MEAEEPRDRHTAFAEGERVGRYQILRRLGAGGMGVVYEARDGELGRLVALKVLHADDDETGALRLAREAQALARLAHPNVVTVFDTGRQGDRQFISMELVDGETLRAWMRRGGRSWREIVRVFLDAGRGLAAAHRAGLVHRDFKPENVLIDREGRVRVTDFGLARSAGLSEEHPGREGPPVGAVTLTHDLAGTPDYMAPEQLLGRAVDARADRLRQLHRR